MGVGPTPENILTATALFGGVAGALFFQVANKDVTDLWRKLNGVILFASFFAAFWMVTLGPSHWFQWFPWLAGWPLSIVYAAAVFIVVINSVVMLVLWKRDHWQKPSTRRPLDAPIY